MRPSTSTPIAASSWPGLLLGMLALAGPAHAECPLPLGPFEARYAMTRNGKPLGETVVRLEAEGAGGRYSLDTRAERGVAGVLGASVTGETHFELADGRLRPLRYSSRQKVFLVRRSESMDFDWDAGTVATKKGSDRWTLPLEGGELDPLLINLEIMRTVVGRDAQAEVEAEDGPGEGLSFQLADIDEIEEQRFVFLAPRTVVTPAGEFETVGLARVHNNPDRKT